MHRLTFQANLEQDSVGLNRREGIPVKLNRPAVFGDHRDFLHVLEPYKQLKGIRPRSLKQPIASTSTNSDQIAQYIVTIIFL